MHIIGHRGSAGTHIENTMPSFVAAIEAGAEAAELDIRPARSGELVIIHNKDLKHLAGIPRAVADMTWQELSEVTLRTEHLPGQEGKIPLLDELLTHPRTGAALKNGFQLSLEIKDRTVPADVARWVVKNELQHQSVIYSFHAEDLEAVLKVSRDLRTNFLFGDNRDENLLLAKEIGAWSINPEKYDADEEYIARAHRAGLEVSIGNTNTREELREKLHLDAWGIHSDWPAMAVEERAKL